MSEEMTKTNKRGCGKGIAIGCASILVLAAIGGFFAYRGIKGFIAEMTEKYTYTTPLELPRVDVSEDEAKAVLERLDIFTKALNQKGQPSALVLTARDINVLIHRHPGWTNMAGKVYVTIEEDRLHGQVSIPLDDVGDMFTGRYLNGSAVFRIDMSAGRLLVFIDSVIVGETAIPEEFMSALRAKNLAEDVNKDPDSTELLQKLDSITVRDGSLSIVPTAL